MLEKIYQGLEVEHVLVQFDNCTNYLKGKESNLVGFNYCYKHQIIVIHGLPLIMSNHSISPYQCNWHVLRPVALISSKKYNYVMTLGQFFYHQENKRFWASNTHFSSECFGWWRVGKASGLKQTAKHLLFLFCFDDVVTTLL